jgi:Uma2 family endonuclease
MFVYFSEAQVKHNDFRGPDVFVVLNTSRRSRKSWVAWGEGKLPDVVIELLSFRTRHVDKGEKMRIYSKLWRTPEYFLYDPISHEFEGYRLDLATLEYVPIVPRDNGDLDCKVLDLRLGIREGLFEDVRWPWLRWLDASGAPLATPQERADDAEQRADEERRRADALEARLRELEESARHGR